MATVTLELKGLESQTVEAEMLRIEDGCAIVRGYLGGEESYSLTTGRRIGGNWDFWRLSEKDRHKLRK